MQKIWIKPLGGYVTLNYDIFFLILRLNSSHLKKQFLKYFVVERNNLISVYKIYRNQKKNIAVLELIFPINILKKLCNCINVTLKVTIINIEWKDTLKKSLF